MYPALWLLNFYLWDAVRLDKLPQKELICCHCCFYLHCHCFCCHIISIKCMHLLTQFQCIHVYCMWAGSWPQGMPVWTCRYEHELVSLHVTLEVELCGMLGSAYFNVLRELVFSASFHSGGCQLMHMYLHVHEHLEHNYEKEVVGTYTTKE